jgi:cobalt/nickel transport system permease protein
MPIMHPTDVHDAMTDGLFQRLDPRIRLITAFLLVIGVLSTPEYAWTAYPLMWTLVGSLAVLSRLSIWRLSRQAGVALPFALAAITLLVTTPGQPLLTAGSLTITDAGLGRFLGIMLKSWLAAQIALLLTQTTPVPDLIVGLRGLGLPETLTAALRLMLRYLLTVRDEAERLLRARAARSGGQQRGSLLWRARVTGGMVGSLFLRSYERSERVYAAMLSRGYDHHRAGSPLSHVIWRDVGLGLVPVIVMIGIQIGVRS